MTPGKVGVTRCACRYLPSEAVASMTVNQDGI